ncbi:MAG: DHH family phosphoesterase [Clostridia bacterium]|nr:DHH family phosphoesterase [Clostridia bacterium]
MKSFKIHLSRLEIVVYCMLAVFSLITMTVNLWLGLAELAFAVFYVIFNILNIEKRNRNIYSYLQNITSYLDEATRDNLTNFPMPITLLNERGEIIWYNDLFHQILHDGNIQDIFGQKVRAISKNLSFDQLKKHQSGKYDITFADKKYTVYILSQGEEGKGHFYAVYWMDNHTLHEQIHKLRGDTLCVAYILLDSYDEIPESISSVQKNNFLNRVDVRIRQLSRMVNGLLQKPENDRYILFFERRYYEKLRESKFKILNEIKDIRLEDALHATLSIGVGLGDGDILKADEAARGALELALSRGGDQAAVTNADKERYDFYGGNSESGNRRKRVKVRLMADAIRAQIERAEHVYIMGHKYADLDCIGASVGIAKCVSSLGKKPHILYNLQANLCQDMLDMLLETDYRDILMEISHMTKAMAEDALLIVVDTHDTDYIESERVLKMFERVIIIDHHRRAVDGAITETVVSFHEPNASSASEMVTELTENIKNCKLNKVEARSLLAGIILDTKNFTERTGSRTFEAAAALRKAGADPQEIRGFFKNDMQSYRKQMEMIGKVEMVTDHIAVAAWDDEPFDGIKVIAAKAADELLNVANIAGAFVLYEEGGYVHISGRCDSTYNVQTILEELGGGGHRASAGAQVKDLSLEEVREKLVELIRREEKGEKEE